MMMRLSWMRDPMSTMRESALGAHEWFMKRAMLPAMVASTWKSSSMRKMYEPSVAPKTLFLVYLRMIASFSEDLIRKPWYSISISPLEIGSLTKRPQPWMAERATLNLVRASPLSPFTFWTMPGSLSTFSMASDSSWRPRFRSPFAPAARDSPLGFCCNFMYQLPANGSVRAQPDGFNGSAAVASSAWS